MTAEELRAQGVAEGLATRVVAAQHLAELLEIAHLAGDMQTPLRLTAETFHGVTAIIDLDWVAGALAASAGEDRWEQRAVEGLVEHLVDARRALTRDILARRTPGPVGGEVGRCLAAYVAEHEDEIEAARRLVDDVRSAPHPTLAAMVVVMREIGRLSGVAAV